MRNDLLVMKYCNLLQSNVLYGCMAGDVLTQGSMACPNAYPSASGKILCRKEEGIACTTLESIVEKLSRSPNTAYTSLPARDTRELR